MAGGNPPKPPSNKSPNPPPPSSHRNKSHRESSSSISAAAATTTTTTTPSNKKPSTSEPNKPKPTSNNLKPPTPKPKPSPKPTNPSPKPEPIQLLSKLPPIPFPDPPPPPSYGFHMLDRRTFVLADGSVRSYFALPPDYQDFTPLPPRPEFRVPGLRFDRNFPMNPDFRGPELGEMGDGFMRGRSQEYRNVVGFEGRGNGLGMVERPVPGTGPGNSIKRKFGDEERGGRDGFERQRQQLLQYGNADGYLSGVPGPSSGGRGRVRGEEMRAAKFMRIDEGNVGKLKHNEVDQAALEKAFLHFVKIVYDNPNQKKKYLADGKQGSLQCIACGLGGSTRVYRLHWVPLSHAYDMNNPFVPPLDELEPMEEKAEQTHPHQDEDGSCLQDDQTESMDDYVDGLDLLFADVTMTSPMNAPLLPEAMKSSFSFEEDTENKIPSGETLPQSDFVLELDKENSNLQIHFASPVSQTFCEAEDPESPLVISHKRSGVSIWERRGKSASVHIQTGRDRQNCTNADTDLEVELGSNKNVTTGSIPEDLLTAADSVEGEVFTPEKENYTPDTPLNRPSKEINPDKMKYGLCGNPLLSSMDKEDEEAFTPDKENITPKSHLIRSMKKMGMLEEINHPKTYRSSPLKSAGSYNHDKVDMLLLSGNEDQLNKLLQENISANRTSRSLARSEADILKVREDRISFRSLLVNSSKTKSEASDLEGTTRSCISVNNPQTKVPTHPFQSSSEEDKMWTMVVDTACLLDKESRKALQLMEGLRGTSLVIPRVVIRELDCMKRHGTLFRRTIGVDSALQWIEQCMVNAKWWIHVQSSVEDLRPVAPTPLAFPLSESNEEKRFSIGSVPFSPCGSLLNMVSPTTEDHVLECALFFRRIRNNGQLVLLSNNVTLKIKAMAEGFRCETAGEFRERLVNPFSERFLWTASSPRGPTWSCLDDVVLKEKYYDRPSRKQLKLGEAAKGLKLILLHNSHYKQISSVS